MFVTFKRALVILVSVKRLPLFTETFHNWYLNEQRMNTIGDKAFKWRRGNHWQKSSFSLSHPYYPSLSFTLTLSQTISPLLCLSLSLSLSQTISPLLCLSLSLSPLLCHCLFLSIASSLSLSLSLYHPSRTNLEREPNRQWNKYQFAHTFAQTNTRPS